MSNVETGLNKTLSISEQWLNIAGYIPGVSSVSGALRIAGGKTEIIGAVGASAIVALAALSAADSAERRQGLRRAVTILTTYLLHGIANVFRGSIEMIPFLSLMTCLPYDLLGNRFTYPHEGNYRWGLHQVNA